VADRRILPGVKSIVYRDGLAAGEVNPLASRMRELAVQEALVAREAARLASGCAEAGVRDILAHVSSLATDHLRALEARSSFLFGERAAAPGRSGKTTRSPLSPSAALKRLYALLHEAVAGYAVLQATATRFRDSWIAATEGTAAHLARQHTQEYLAASGRITQLLHDVVIDELDRAGYACGCTCPGCGAGICLCAVGGRSILGEAWATGRALPFVDGIEVHQPRPGSPAALSGLQRGDVITHVDGARLGTAAVLISAIKNGGTSDEIQLTVLRGGEELTLRLQRASEPSHLANVPGDEDDCIRPSGPAFHHARARDLREQLRRPGSNPRARRFGILSPREIEVVRAIASGATNPQVAERLHISRATVARHVANILEKLSLANRTEVASAAASLGLLEDS
jgi:DNA-binding CsgD family transcriptional regulator